MKEFVSSLFICQLYQCQITTSCLGIQNCNQFTIIPFNFRKMSSWMNQKMILLVGGLTASKLLNLIYWTRLVHNQFGHNMSCTWIKLNLTKNSTNSKYKMYIVYMFKVLHLHVNIQELQSVMAFLMPFWYMYIFFIFKLFIFWFFTLIHV